MEATINKNTTNPNINNKSNTNQTLNKNDKEKISKLLGFDCKNYHIETLNQILLNLKLSDPELNKLLTEKQNQFNRLKNNEDLTLQILPSDFKGETLYYNVVKHDKLPPTLDAYYHCEKPKTYIPTDKEAAILRTVKLENNATVINNNNNNNMNKDDNDEINERQIKPNNKDVIIFFTIELC